MFKKILSSTMIMLFSGAPIHADPTRPAAGLVIDNEAQAYQPSLDAIFVTEAGRKAVIDGSIYLEAQQKNGLTVIRIEKNSVEVEYLKNGERKLEVLSLAKSGFVFKSEADK